MFSFRWRERLGKTAERYLEEFLNYLVTHYSFPGFDCATDQLGGDTGFFRSGRVKGINKDVGIEEKLSAHSFRPEYKDQQSIRVEAAP